MSWNLIILPRNPDDDTATLGDARDVRAALDRGLANVDWPEPGSGVFTGQGLRIEIALQREGQVESFMLHVTGEGHPLPLVVGLCRNNGWTIFDAVAGDYLDLDNPSDQGWQGYLAHIAGKVIPPDEQ